MKVLLEKIKLEDDYCPVCELNKRHHLLHEDDNMESMRTYDDASWVDDIKEITDATKSGNTTPPNQEEKEKLRKVAEAYIKRITKVANEIHWIGEKYKIKRSFSTIKSEAGAQKIVQKWLLTFSKYMIYVLELAPTLKKDPNGKSELYINSIDKLTRDILGTNAKISRTYAESLLLEDDDMETMRNDAEFPEFDIIDKYDRVIREYLKAIKETYGNFPDPSVIRTQINDDKQIKNTGRLPRLDELVEILKGLHLCPESLYGKIENDFNSLKQRKGKVGRTNREDVNNAIRKAEKTALLYIKQLLDYYEFEKLSNLEDEKATSAKNDIDALIKKVDDWLENSREGYSKVKAYNEDQEVKESFLLEASPNDDMGTMRPMDIGDLGTGERQDGPFEEIVKGIHELINKYFDGKFPACNELDPDDIEKTDVKNHITFDEAWKGASNSYHVTQWYTIWLNPFWEKEHTVWQANEYCWQPGYVKERAFRDKTQGLGIGTSMLQNDPHDISIGIHAPKAREAMKKLYKFFSGKDGMNLKSLWDLAGKEGSPENTQTFVKMGHQTVIKGSNITEKEYVIREYFMSLGIFNGGQVPKDFESLRKAYLTESRLWHSILGADIFQKFVGAMHFDEFRSKNNTFVKALNTPQLFYFETKDSNPSKGYEEERGIIDTQKAFDNIYNVYVKKGLYNEAIDTKNPDNLKPFGSIALDKNLYIKFNTLEVKAILDSDIVLIQDKNAFIEMISPSVKRQILNKQRIRASESEMNEKLAQLDTNIIRRYVFYNDQGMLYTIVELRDRIPESDTLQGDFSADNKTLSADELLTKLDSMISKGHITADKVVSILEKILVNNRQSYISDDISDLVKDNDLAGTIKKLRKLIVEWKKKNNPDTATAPKKNKEENNANSTEKQK